ncbi:endonuclease/exonuclease/phosphatase family protein [Streptomyces solincola]|uniref:endonuclease/exonuclease/phosphatase family protein n=1 Tax=Streptomyces solincola TaxID=2100817 RepID=UPI0021593314|nr:endonuclease/exonuclease/phosphatase family protein [Streptomyces solincola]
MGAARRGTPGRLIAAAAALTAGVLLLPRVLPDAASGVGGLLETFLPWSWLVIVVLAALALLRRSAVALGAVVLPVAAWAVLFGGLLLPVTGSTAHGLVVVNHNVSDENPDPAGTARAVAGAGADLVALQELVPSAREVYARVLADRYPHHTVHGTVGLWSRYPLRGADTVAVKPAGIPEPWSRGLRAVARTPHGDVAVYVAHLPSVRLGAGGLAAKWRDESARMLGDAIAAEEVARVVLLGDLNGTAGDRGLRPLTSRLEVAERGFAFSFPAGFPVVRIDQVMARAAAVAEIRALPATGSDHRPVLGRVRWDGDRE